MRSGQAQQGRPLHGFPLFHWLGLHSRRSASACILPTHGQHWQDHEISSGLPQAPLRHGPRIHSRRTRLPAGGRCRRIRFARLRLSPCLLHRRPATGPGFLPLNHSTRWRLHPRRAIHRRFGKRSLPSRCRRLLRRLRTSCRIPSQTGRTGRGTPTDYHWHRCALSSVRRAFHGVLP